MSTSCNGSNVYTLLIRPLLEYATWVWDPGGEGLKREIKMVQRRAARFVVDDYDSSSVTSAVEAS